MKVLVACEFSGVVRDAFITNGHDTLSCDLLPCERPGPHYQGDVRNLLNEPYDLMVAHPPCTYLCSSGLHWNKRRPGRDALTNEAMGFVFALVNAPIPKIALENPVGRISTAYRKPDQIIQPYQFRHDASKGTCLWLKGLPLLRPTKHIEPHGSRKVVVVSGVTRPLLDKTNLARRSTVPRSVVGPTKVSPRRWPTSGAGCVWFSLTNFCAANAATNLFVRSTTSISLSARV